MCLVRLAIPHLENYATYVEQININHTMIYLFHYYRPTIQLYDVVNGVVLVHITYLSMYVMKKYDVFNVSTLLRNLYLIRHIAK